MSLWSKGHNRKAIFSLFFFFIATTGNAQFINKQVPGGVSFEGTFSKSSLPNLKETQKQLTSFFLGIPLIRSAYLLDSSVGPMKNGSRKTEMLYSLATMDPALREAFVVVTAHQKKCSETESKKEIECKKLALTIDGSSALSWNFKSADSLPQSMQGLKVELNLEESLGKTKLKGKIRLTDSRFTQSFQRFSRAIGQKRAPSINQLITGIQLYSLPWIKKLVL